MTSMSEVAEEGREQYEAYEFEWYKRHRCVARYHLARLFPARNDAREWVDATGRRSTTADTRAACRSLLAMARRDDARWLAAR